MIAVPLRKNRLSFLCNETPRALDYMTGKQILQLLQDTCRKEGITIIIITHNSAIAQMADKVIRFKSGEVVDITVNTTPKQIEEIGW